MGNLLILDRIRVASRLESIFLPREAEKKALPPSMPQTGRNFWKVRQE